MSYSNIISTPTKIMINPYPSSFIPVKQASDKNVDVTLNGNTVSFDSKVSKDNISLIIKAMIE